MCINPQPGQFGTPAMVIALMSSEIQYVIQQSRNAITAAKNTACRNLRPNGCGSAIDTLSVSGCREPKDTMDIPRKRRGKYLTRFELAGSRFVVTPVVNLCRDADPGFPVRNLQYIEILGANRTVLLTIESQGPFGEMH